MWKQIPIIVSSAAGLRFQVEHEKNGLIIGDATNLHELTRAMDRMLINPKTREKWEFKGQIRQIERFTIFSQLDSWLKLMNDLRED